VVQWLTTGAALLLAVAALLRARSLGRRLELLTRHYWELRYQHGELRAHLRRLDPDTAREDDPAPPAPPAGAFIPLSAVKR
jgi:hypothetical protein